MALGCRKENTSGQMNKNVVGKWLFVSSRGGFTGKDVILPGPGTTSYLVLNADLGYQVMQNGKVQKEGKYATALQQSYVYGTVRQTIRYDNESQFQTYTVNSDSLLVSDDQVEGYTTLYLKKN